MSDLRDRFESDGYVLIRDVIDFRTLLALRAFFLPVFQRQGRNVLHDAVLHYPNVFDLLRTPRLVESLRTLLGADFVVPPYTSVELNRFGVFHTDTTGAEISGQTFHKDPGFRIVTLAIYLQDNNEYGGGIRLVPGSHRRPDPYVELTRRKAAIRRRIADSHFRRTVQRLSGGRLYNWNRPFLEHEASRDIPSRVGDAIIWDLRIVHRASPMRAREPAPDGGKISIFFNCAANNGVTRDAYLRYVASIPENEFLRKPRPRPPVIATGDAPEITIL